LKSNIWRKERERRALLSHQSGARLAGSSILILTMRRRRGLLRPHYLHPYLLFYLDGGCGTFFTTSYSNKTVIGNEKRGRLAPFLFAGIGFVWTPNARKKRASTLSPAPPAAAAAAARESRSRGQIYTLFPPSLATD